MDAGEDVGEAPAAGRPAPLLEVLPQERVQQRIVEQIVDPVPLVPLLHDVVPQMVEQLVDFLSPLDFRIAEQVIEVPNIVCPPRRRWKSWWKCRRPFPFLRYCSRLLSRTLTFQLLAVVELVEVFPAFSRDRILQRCGTEPLTFLLVEVFQVFNVDRVQQRFWSRSPCPQFQVEVFKVFNQFRVQQRLLRFRRPQKAEQLVEVPPEPGYALAVVAVKTRFERSTAGGLDGWGWKELKALLPPWFDGLARILRLVEETGVWPDGLLDAYGRYDS